MDSTTVSDLIATARFGPKQPASGSDGMVVTSHPVVTRTAIDVLRAGGNAVDAGLAAAAVQTVVEPHMSTICGALCLLHHDATTGQTTYLNGNMNAPLAPLPDFGPNDFRTGRGVAVPGFWAAFEAALARYGTWSKAKLLSPAIELARDGFEVYPFLYGVAFEQLETIGRYPEGREIFLPRGSLLNPGERLRQPRLACTLERLVDEGTEYLYRGAFARRFVEVVQEAGGVLTMEDLERYEVRWQEPASGTYRGYEVLASPPPDNGGAHIIEILNLVEQIPLAQWGPADQSVDTLYWLLRFCGEVYTEGARQRDPEHFPLPLDLLLSKEYAATRFELMRMADPAVGGGTAPAHPGSNQVTVVDGRGNAVTLLHSVSSMPWSNGLYVDGVQVWAGAGHFLRTMPPPGGRASSYIAPSIILSDGRPLLVAGSPSVSLIQCIVQNTLHILDFGLEIAESVHRPRFGARALTAGAVAVATPTYYIEADFDEALLREVAKRGLSLEPISPWHHHNGSYEGVRIGGDGTASACADPRRAGLAQAV